MRAIFAGNGALPLILADYISKKYQQAPLILTVTPDYDKSSLAQYPHEPCDIGQIAQCFALLKKHHCDEVIFAGKIPRDYFHRTEKDALAQQYFEQIQNKGDDYAVRIAYDLFQQHGFTIIAPQQICPDILCQQAGELSAHQANAAMLTDIKRGKEVLDILSPADVGQAIVIHQGLVLGVEAIEGTNGLIERCAPLQLHGQCHDGSNMQGGAVLVKLPKKNQTHMMDLPAIGLETIELIAKHRFAGIAVQKNGVLLVGGQDIIKTANQHQLFIHALPQDTP